MKLLEKTVYVYIIYYYVNNHSTVYFTNNKTELNINVQFKQIKSQFVGSVLYNNYHYVSMYIFEHSCIIYVIFLNEWTFRGLFQTRNSDYYIVVPGWPSFAQNEN